MFHRLTAPTYIGGLPGGYDYINNLLVGTPAPVDPAKVGGPNAGTYFVAFGEDGRAAAANRAVASVAANTDVIDDFLHADTAVTASVDINPLGPAVIVGTANNPVFRGPPGTPNTTAGLEPYFHITDLAGDDVVDPGTNTQVKVTAISPAGTGFYAGALTLTLSPAPTGPFRIWYGTRSSLAEMTKGEFVRPNVWGVQRKQAGFIQFTNNLINPAADNTKGGSLVGIYDTTFNNATTPGGGLKGLGINNVQKAIQKINDRFVGGAGKVDIDSDGFIDTAALTPIRGGGIGMAFAPGSVQDAMNVVDKQLVRRRAFTAVMTDGTTTVGGDYNGSNIDAMLTNFNGPGGTYFARQGQYFIANGIGSVYGSNTSIESEGQGVVLLLDPARSLDLGLSGLFDLSRATIGSQSSTYKRFKVVTSSSIQGTRFTNCLIQAGAVFVADGTDGFFELNKCDVLAAPALGGTSTNAGMDISGEVRTSIRNSTFTGANGTTPRNFYLHDQTDPSKSGTIVENSYFLASGVNVNAVELNNVSSYVTFTNCVFQVTATSGTGYAARITDCSRVTFNNCRFVSANGQVIKSTTSTTHFNNCVWESSDGTPGAATGQMVVIQQGGQGASTVNNCRCVIGASSVRGSAGTIQKTLVELGGLDGTASSSSGLSVNVLFIRYSTATALTHNYTAVLLHGSASSRFINLYRGVQFDANSTDSSGAGTPGGNYFAAPFFVEIGGGLSKSNCIVEDLQIVNVVNPTADHTGGVLYAVNCIAKNVTVDGSAIAHAGGFTNVLITFTSSRVENLYICKNQQIREKGVAGWILGLDNSRLSGGAMYGGAGNVADLPAGTLAWVVLGNYAVLDDYIISINAHAALVQHQLVILVGGAGRVTASDLAVDNGAVAYGITLISSAGNDCKITDNRLMTGTSGFAQINLAGTNTISLNNLCAASVGAPPAATIVTGAGSAALDYQVATLFPTMPS